MEAIKYDNVKAYKQIQTANTTLLTNMKIRSNQHSALKQWVKKVSWNIIKKDGKCPVINPTDFLP